MSHKDEGLKTRHRQYWKKIEADSVVLDPGIIAISWEDSTIRLHDGYTIGGRIFSMLPAPSLTVHVLTPLSGNGSVSAPIALNIAALANQVPVLANAPITGTGIIGNPLDIDEAALALALTNQVGVAHDASLVGTGTTGAPLSVNWGLAPAQPVAHNATLSGNGTAGSPLSVVPAALASQIPVSAITPITGNGTLASPLTVDTPALIPALNNKVTVVTDGVTITGAGIVGNPLVAIPVPATVVAASPLTGNGSIATPLDVNIASLIAEISAAGGVPVAHDGSMLGMGTTLSPLSVNWANMPALSVQHDTSMTGQGTAGNPLSVNWSQAPAINVNHDGTMIGSGTLASPLSVNTIALANLVPVTVGAGLTGNGTTASPIAPNPSVLGPALSGLVPVAVSAPLTGTGTAASPLGITNATGAARGVVQLATAAEGLQPANDVDAVTPAYIAAAISAIPGDKYLASVGAYNAATNVFNLNMSDGSVVPVDLTAAVADAVASVPNKHVPATLASPLGSIIVAASGTDNQTLEFDTNAGLIPIADAGGYFAGTSVEAALQEIGANSLPYATVAEIQAGHPNKIVTADDMAAAQIAGVNHSIWSNAPTTAAGNAAIRGTASILNSYGVWGANTAGTGVLAQSDSGRAVEANSNTGIGVDGTSVSSYGVRGVSDTGGGVFGSSTSNFGIYAYIGAGNTTNALYAQSNDGYAGRFRAVNEHAVHCWTNNAAKYAVTAQSANIAANAYLGRADTYGIYATFVTPVSGNNIGSAARFDHTAGGDAPCVEIVKSNSGPGDGIRLTAAALTSGDGIRVLQNGTHNGAGLSVYSYSALGAYFSKEFGGVPAAANPVVEIHQKASSNSRALYAEISATGGSGAGSDVAVFANINSGLNTFILPAGGVYGVQTNGAIFASGGFVPSDKRKKTDITPVENALDLVGKLNGYYYRWADTASEFAIMGNARQFGVIAQEVQNVLPELVTSHVEQLPDMPVAPPPPVPTVPPMQPESDADETAIAAYKAAVLAAEARNADMLEGYELAHKAYKHRMQKYEEAVANHTDEPTLAVDYAKLTALLISAVNELRKEVTDLRARLSVV